MRWPVRFSLVVHVVQDAEGAVVSRGWLNRQLRHANQLFRPHGVSFELAERRALAGDHARLENRRDRHRLGAYLQTDVINVFIVRALRDVDEPERFRQGVHWRPRGRDYADGLHFVILSAIAQPYVFAHELGHFFGNRHSDVPGNLMSYEDAPGPPFLDPVQVRRIRDSARRFVRSGELRPSFD